MNFTPIIRQAIEPMLWLLPIIILFALLRTPSVKGYLGELWVRVAARLRLDRRVYRAVHDVTLPTPDGTTQIDHVFVSPYGIFVVETKHYRGWIFGGERQATWTQKLYRKSYKFQNPLRQNYKHVKALQAALVVPEETIHSMVVFVGDCTFKTAMPANVTQGAGYIRFIKSHRERVLGDAEVERLVDTLQRGRLTPSRATRRAHVEQLRKRADPDAERLCPKCGSKLVLRTVKSGARAGTRFWGCSEFPRCRVRQAVG